MKTLLTFGRVAVCVLVLSLPASAGLIDNPGSPAPDATPEPTPTATAPTQNPEGSSSTDTSASLLEAAWLAIQSLIS